MEKYCVSLDIAKKLKVAGWNYHTHYVYENGNNLCRKYITRRRFEHYAPMSDELLERLPEIINHCFCENGKDGKIEYILEMKCINNEYVIAYNNKQFEMCVNIKCPSPNVDMAKKE